MNDEKDEVWKVISDILVGEFEVEPELVTRGAHMRDDLGLDSLDQVDLVVELERFAGQRIENDVLRTLSTVGDTVDLIRGLRADASAPH